MLYQDLRLKGLAGVEGIEPPVVVLETTGLPLTDTPRALVL